MKQYADKYFLRSNEILKAEGLNPWVNMQVFVRQGPGKVDGMDEAVRLIADNSNIAQVGGRIYAKRDGDAYQSTETVMNIVAPIQEIMELETIYLGALTKGITLANGGKTPDLKDIGKNVAQVVELAGKRPVLYFGARHWHYEMDAAIAKTAFDNGASDASTDNGAATLGKKGVGTIPHALENIYAWKYGKDNAVVEATKAFDRVMDPAIRRIALVDYNNKEITDSIATAEALGDRLFGVRVDTPGENIAEGGFPSENGDPGHYWTGTGVTIKGVGNLRQGLDRKGYRDVKIILTSGFSNPNKVQAFDEAKKALGLQLYDGIGAGFLDGPRTATADIIAVGETIDDVDYNVKPLAQKNIIHKVGRPPKENKTLERIL